MITRKVKIPANLHYPAINAWWYVGETVKACRDAGRDYEFMNFVLCLRNEYPDEYDFYIAVTRGEV